MDTPKKQPTAKQALDFFQLLHSLKVTKRGGWVRKSIMGPESISDHMYRMSMMALVATDANVDVNKCVTMALVHDVAESLVGDITPHDGISRETKRKMESEAMAKIKQLLGADTYAGEIQKIARQNPIENLWQEYESASTPEARFVKDLDKLEMILQAHEYEDQQNIDLSEFFDSTEGLFTTETGKAWAEEVVTRRRKARMNRSKT